MSLTQGAILCSAVVDAEKFPQTRVFFVYFDVKVTSLLDYAGIKTNMEGLHGHCDLELTICFATASDTALP